MAVAIWLDIVDSEFLEIYEQISGNTEDSQVLKNDKIQKNGMILNIREAVMTNYIFVVGR